MSETFFKVCCPSCETVFEVTDSALIGQIVACPKCGGMILIEDPSNVSQGEESAHDERPLNVREEVVAPPVISDDVVPPPLPEVDEPLDDEDISAETTKRIWRARLVLVLAGAICALLVAWATQFLSAPREEVASQTSVEANKVENEGDVPEETIQESVEEQGDAEDEEFVFVRDESDEANEEFDARYAVELGDEETDPATDSTIDGVSDEGDDVDESGNDESEESVLDLGELEQNADDEDELDESGAISTEFDEEEFERANKNDEENENSDADEEEEDLGSIASTTDVSFQNSLPTLKQAAKEIDVESRMKLRFSSITFPESPAAAVRLLAEFSGVPIDFDLKYFELTRSSIESTLNLSLNDSDVEGALNELAVLLKWNVLVGKDRITLVPKDADDALIEERFDLTDLLGDSSRIAPIEYRGETDEISSEEPLSLDVLSKMASTLVEPESWRVNGEEGQGVASGEGTTLIVKHNALNRKRVGDLFERLRALRGLELHDSSLSSSLIAEALGWERLTKKISFNLLKPLTLQQAIEILERTQKIQILWDDAVLNDFGVGRDVVTVARIDEATIDQTLFDLLEPHKLTYVILDENLFLITTKEHAENYKTVEIHMFSSEKKELTEKEARELADEMKTAVSPKSWDGSDVSLWIDSQSGCWIVRQSQPNQRAIRRWLDERR